MRKSERSLSVNRPGLEPSREGSQCSSAPQSVLPFHEPRAKAGASSTHSKRCRAVAERLGLREAFGVRPACRRFSRFMVPVHAQVQKEALLPQKTVVPSKSMFDVW